MLPFAHSSKYSYEKLMMTILYTYTFITKSETYSNENKDRRIWLLNNLSGNERALFLLSVIKLHLLNSSEI